MDKLTIIRSVDCSASDHTPITFQTGNALARRTNDGKDGGGYPSMGSIASWLRGPNDPGVPAFVGLSGELYPAIACILGGALLWLAVGFARDRTDASARLLFFGSITYLPLLWATMIVDRL